MAATSPRLRATAALAVGAFALHQGRYLLGYGGASGDALSAHGHGYLTLLVPLLALLAAAAAAQFVTALARADAGAAGGRRSRFGAVWLAATLTLLATYAGQELLEGLLATGHPDSAAALLAGGGWWALPLAAAIGLAVALLLRAATLVIEAAARRHRRHHPRRRARFVAPSPVSADLPALSVFGRNLAGRAPPPLSV